MAQPAKKPATYADLEALPPNMVFRLNGERYELASTHAQDEVARAAPFGGAELPLAELWSR